MSYLISKDTFKRNSHESISYRIEWDEEVLLSDTEAEAVHNGTPTPLFNAYCITSEGKTFIGSAHMLSGATEHVKEHFGAALSWCFWVQYCYNVNKNGKKYTVYLTWNESNREYTLAISRDQGKQIYPYSSVSDDDISDAFITTGNNLCSAIMEIAENDIATGIMDRFIDGCEFVLDEYIADATQELFCTISRCSEMWATSDPITHLCFNALNAQDGTHTLPTYQVDGEISLLVRGHIADDRYEFSTKLRLKNGVWRFVKESVAHNNQYTYARTLRADGIYITSKDHSTWDKDFTQINHSQLKLHLPDPICQWLKNIK